MKKEEEKILKSLKNPKQKPIKRFKEKSKVGKALQQIARHGTVTVRVRTGGLGFQIKGYHGQPPKAFDLRGNKLSKLIKEAKALQKKGK